MCKLVQGEREEPKKILQPHQPHLEGRAPLCVSGQRPLRPEISTPTNVATLEETTQEAGSKHYMSLTGVAQLCCGSQNVVYPGRVPGGGLDALTLLSTLLLATILHQPGLYTITTKASVKYPLFVVFVIILYPAPETFTLPSGFSSYSITLLLLPHRTN